MCGRFVGSYRVEDLLSELGDDVEAAGLTLSLPDTDVPLLNSFNVAPTQHVPVLIRRENEIIVEVMQWGLVPSWSKDPKIGAKMINARAETVTEKVSFKSLVSSHRCIVPISGFYEWNRSGSQPKTPYYVTRADGHLILVAGLWTRSALVEGEFSFSMITRSSGEDLGRVHDRTPAHLTSLLACDWLTGDLDSAELMNRDAQPILHFHQVSTEVNSVRNNRASLIDALGETNVVNLEPLIIEEEEHPRLF
ncbi:MAG: putative response-associated peptidase YedK [Actinomycetota bacterium]|jgi:putative SOS response-associated peptidase YedK